MGGRDSLCLCSTAFVKVMQFVMEPLRKDLVRYIVITLFEKRIYCIRPLLVHHLGQCINKDVLRHCFRNMPSNLMRNMYPNGYPKDTVVQHFTSNVPGNIARYCHRDSSNVFTTFPSCNVFFCCPQLGEGVELTLGELRAMALRQQQQIDNQHQLLCAKEQRLRYLKQQEARQHQVTNF